VVDSGADLAEFAGGLAELLRALVMRHYDAEPEGLPESTRGLIADIAPRLGPEDAVRMLKMLGEAEGSLRRSANPRIGLETLLLRWAMMDRAMDLRAVLAGGVPLAGSGGKPIPQTSPKPRAQSPEPEAQGPEPKAQSPKPNGLQLGAQAPDPSSRGLRALGFGLTQETLAAAWSDIIATATRQSPMLGQALAHATPRVEKPDVVALMFGPDSALFQDGATRQLGAVETILTAALGTPVKVKVQSAAGATAGDSKPRRLSVEDVRNERLTQLRSKDAALDAAATALDLELVDED
jgi:DNA polymerase-3 subunit gamma/tau